MSHFLHKKTLPILISLVFFVLGFGSFSGTASADIAKDIAESLNLSLQPSALYGIEEIPSDLTSAQSANILNEIITDRGVTTALEGVRDKAPAQSKAENDYKYAVDLARESLSFLGGSCSGSGTATQCNADIAVTAGDEKDALDKANAEYDEAVEVFRKALVLARKSQNAPIKSAQAENLVENSANVASKQISGTTASSSEKFQAQAEAGIGAQEAGGVNQADIDAAAQRDKEASQYRTAAGGGGGISSSGGGTRMTVVAVGTGSIAGTTLTITNQGSGTFNVGQTLTGTLVQPGTKITGLVRDEPNKYTVSPSQTVASTQISGNASVATGKYADKKDEIAVRMHAACSILPGWVGGGGTNLMPCFAEGVYYVYYKPASIAFAMAGMAFDYMLMLSIDNSKDMVVPVFIGSAWTVLRDFSNMLFIFILLYTGIMTMFGAADWRKTVLQVVFIAILINFSLFFTKVVIDAGNVLAMGVKSAIQPEGGTISEGLVDSFKPQKFLTIAAGADIGNSEATNAIIVFLIAGAVTGFAAWIFFKVALLFLGRLIGFWFLMIMSPFAFISTALPNGNKFHEWFSNLLGLSFVAPVFLFFLYLIMMVIQADSGILNKFSDQGTGWVNSLLGPVLVATLLIFALKKALEFAENMSGDFGKTASGLISAAVSGASVVATGGAALAGMAGRKFIGGAAAEELAKGVDKNGVALTDARRATLEARTKSSYDVRNLVGGKDSMIGKITSGKVFAKEYGVGGVEAKEQDRIKKELGAVEKGKLSTFAEQGMRSNPQLVNDAVANNIKDMEQEEAKAEDTLIAEKKALETAEKGMETTMMAVKAATSAYEDAQARAERDKGSVYEAESSAAAAKLKGDLDVAQKKHESSPATLEASTAVARVKKAEAALKAAEEKTKGAKAVAEMDDEGKATWAIKNENDKRRSDAASKAAAEGRHVTAAKIRKGETGGKSVEDTLKDLLKKEKEERASKGGDEQKPKTEPVDEPKH